MKYILLFMVLIMGVVSGQDAITQDSSALKEPIGIPVRYGTHDSGIMVRTTIGFQKSVYASLGIARTVCNTTCTGFAFGTYYAGITWNAVPGNDVYGFTTGAEYTLMGLAVGVSSTYQSNFKEHDLVFTPKVGIGICGMSLFYGYTISTKDYPFQGLERHQVSVVLHL